jgi:hypothetical protein
VTSAGGDQQQHAAAATAATMVAAQAATRARLTAQAVAMATAAAQSFTGWYDSGQITAWAAGLAQRVETLQRAQAQTTDAYLARVLSQMLGTVIRPVGRVAVNNLREGVTHAGAYARAADAYRWQQAQLDRFAGQLITAAADELLSTRPPNLVSPLDAAVQRATSVANLDVQMADRAQAAAVLEDHADRHDIRGYRRVIHPELSKGGTCGLCVAASDRIYHVSELRAVHGRCECTTLPIVGEQDPGHALNDLDLRRLYKHAGGTDAAGLKRTRYKILEHGELGPVLTDGTLRKARTAKRADKAVKPKTDAEKLAIVRSIRERLDSALPKARDLAKQDPGKWGQYLQSLEKRLTDLDHQLAA